MKQRFDFEDIRPLYDEEVAPAMKEILKEPALEGIFNYLFPNKSFDEIASELLKVNSKKEFQKKFIAPFLWILANKTAASLELLNYDRISKEDSSTFISNHRDIILDAAFLNILLDKYGFDTTEVAIGDNLLIFPWIRDLVRMNKSFIVKRNMPVRQLLEVSRRLSSYIHFALKIKEQSVWIAQREGRSKDSTDHTQESLIKMLAMGGGKDLMRSIKSMNITPVAISYEYDPCDYLKAKEFQLKRDYSDYKKEKKEDLLNMQTGLKGFKGRINFNVAGRLNDVIDSISPDSGKSEQVNAIALLIDKMIHKNFVIYEVNYIAYDWLYQTDNYSDKYTAQQKQQFQEYISQRLDKIDIENKDTEFLTKKLLEMYSNPLINFEKAQ
ncbi:MAG: 1-acyl-sn-glycerol-3-phosphate acyltransferase [Bacteroidales bacterium]|nr:1-acyl-sn-glycerol-3-phosphate acyltransferase [Bacteroidales bacterium]